MKKPQTYSIKELVWGVFIYRIIEKPSIIAQFSVIDKLLHITCFSVSVWPVCYAYFFEKEATPIIYRTQPLRVSSFYCPHNGDLG